MFTNFGIISALCLACKFFWCESPHWTKHAMHWINWTIMENWTIKLKIQIRILFWIWLVIHLFEWRHSYWQKLSAIRNDGVKSWFQHLLRVKYLIFCNSVCWCTTHIANTPTSLSGIIITSKTTDNLFIILHTISILLFIISIAGSASLNKWAILGIIHRLIGNPRDSFNLKLETEININYLPGAAIFSLALLISPSDMLTFSAVLWKTAPIKPNQLDVK